MKTMKEKMICVIDILIEEMEEIHAKENKTLEEMAILSGLVDSIVRVTGYAVIEKKMTSEDLLIELEKYREQSREMEKTQVKGGKTMNILIKTKGLTASENEKLLEVVRRISRKRRKMGEEKIKYLVDFSGKRYVSHPDSENGAQREC